MHTVELLNEALDTARKLGYDVRQDWLGGNGGGHCLVRGRKWVLLDLAQTPEEQLSVVTDAISGDESATSIKISSELAERLKIRGAA